MAAYVYDDFEITLTARADGDYDLVAVAPDGSRDRTVFKVPLKTDELEQAVINIARVRSRKAKAQAAAAPADGLVTREIASAEVASADDDKGAGAERLGAALADALFADNVGKAYDDARLAGANAQRGIRLTLSLGGAPALLSLPWEFLYRRPRFLASNRHTPIVRRLDAAAQTTPLTITDKVRILGVVSNPKEFAKLDVRAERRRVEKAVAKMVNAGRVELTWLESATPRALRQALRDEFHVLHYVGHSSFTAANEGAIYLRNPDGSAAEVDSTVLANLLSDQSSLRLVVLNSCEGARTTLDDPYAGVATTLIQLGVPAVVAMQFEISDEAAILFADELYTNLVGLQDPIDAAVSEARKAIYVELDRVEWATPVLFVRDPNVALFEFAVPVAPVVPQPQPSDLTDEIKEIDETRQVTGGGTGPPPEPWWRRVLRRPVALLAAAVALVTATVGVVALVNDGGGETLPTTTLAATSTTAPATTTTSLPGPPVATGTRTLAATVQLDKGKSASRLYGIDAGTGAAEAMFGSREFRDSDATWSPGVNRLAFTRGFGSGGIGSAIYTIVPGEVTDTGAVAVRPLVPPVVGVFAHHPAWSGASDNTLWYLTADQPSGAGTFELLHRRLVRVDAERQRARDPGVQADRNGRHRPSLRGRHRARARRCRSQHRLRRRQQRDLGSDAGQAGEAAGGERRRAGARPHDERLPRRDRPAGDGPDGAAGVRATATRWPPRNHRPARSTSSSPAKRVRCCSCSPGARTAPSTSRTSR